MFFHDPQDINYNRFWARLVLRLDNELWTNIIDQSGLFDAQGRFIPSEWVSWTHNGKTITFGKVLTKNRGRYSMFCCNSIKFPQVKDYANENVKEGMDGRWLALAVDCYNLETLRWSDFNCSNNSSSNSNNNVVNFEDIWDICSEEVKTNLVNSYLVAVVEKAPQRTPVEIIVTFKNNQKGSLFYIKHKRPQGAKAAVMSANEMETDQQNSNFENFSRRFSHALLKKMLETQGLEANDYKDAIV